MTLTQCAECKGPFKTRPRKRQRFCSIKCATVNSARKRKGRTRTAKGYILIHRPDHPGASKQGYVMQHRLVMEQAMGRLLAPDEVVHHRNGVKGDNRLSNLEVMTRSRHNQEPKKPPHLLPCPHCGNPIWVKDRTKLTVRRVEFHLPPSQP